MRSGLRRLRALCEQSDRIDLQEVFDRRLGIVWYRQ
jgi:hypothetical protein